MMKETNENVTNCQTPPEELPCRGQHLPGVQPRQSASHSRHAHTKYYSLLSTSKYRVSQKPGALLKWPYLPSDYRK